MAIPIPTSCTEPSQIPVSVQVGLHFFMRYYALFLFLLINEHSATSFGKFPPFGGMELAFPLERISSLRPATSTIRTLHVPAHSFRTLIRTRQRNLELAEGIWTSLEAKDTDMAFAFR